VDWNAVGSWLGLVVSIAGFWIAIVQIRKTRKAAEAAALAVAETETRVARNTLLAVVPQFLQLEIDLGAALGSNRFEDAVTVLVRWRHLAAQIRGLVERSDIEEAALGQILWIAIPLVSAAERSLLRSRGPSAAAVRQARQAIGDASAAAGALIGRLQTYTGERWT
jgi:hypothetical protein